MTLQNRVDPFGALIAAPARGTMMGNRGARPLHRPDRTLRAQRSKDVAWICCLLSYKGWSRRPVWGKGYSELFFLDEATALAAGHRPCFLCRRAEAQAYRLAAFGREVPAGEIDAALEAERSRPRPAISRPHADLLPSGAMVGALETGASWLRWDGDWAAWRPQGYGAGVPPAQAQLSLLTPATSLRALAAGFRPRVAL